MSLALLVTNAAEEKSATSYALRTSLQSLQKLSYSLDSACPPPELSIPTHTPLLPPLPPTPGLHSKPHHPVTPSWHRHHLPS